MTSFVIWCYIEIEINLTFWGRMGPPKIMVGETLTQEGVYNVNEQMI